MSVELLSVGLTDAQRAAILHTEGPLLIVAGPGAGKTDVIVRRTARLILEGGVAPQNILVTTFTNKAADELYDRLWPLLGKAVYDLRISTIHSFCQMLLEEHPDAHPWGRRFEVLDDRQQFLFVYARLRDLGLNRFPKARLGDFLADVLATFNLCTEELVDPKAFRDTAAQRGAQLLGLKKTSPEAVEEYVAVAEAYGRYLELLRGEALLDFGMLQRVAYELLQQEDIRAQVADRFRYILVDEYQDTNRLQVLLLKRIAQPRFNVCAVGDDDQSIYRFRGATVSSFLRFDEDFPGAKTIFLDTNFRASPELVEAASALIAHNTPHRRDKDLRAHRPGGHRPVLVSADTCADEAEVVVKLVAELRQRGLIASYNDVAFLFRSVKYHAQEYLRALDRHGVPYTVVADGGFFDREDILHLKDLITFCGWKNKWDPRLLQGKLLELQPKTIEAIARAWLDPSAWVDEAALKELGISDPDERRVLRELATVRVRTQEGDIGTLLELFYGILRASGYFQRCAGRTDAPSGARECEAALLNLGQFSSLLAAFQCVVRTQNAYRFGEYLRTLPARSLDALRPEPPGEAVRVMTVHQAKGLEFPVVVIGSAMQGRFPGRFQPPRYPLPPELRLGGEHDHAQENLRDQRRLFYVAVTRAEDLLIIGAPEKVTRRGGGASLFVEEMGTERLAGVEQLRRAARLSQARHKAHAPARRRLSFSALYSYLLCPLQYKLLYECSFAVPQAHWSQFGQVIHRALELVHRRAAAGEQVNPATASLILEEVWRPMPFRKPAHEKRLKETGREYLIRYCEAHRDRFMRVHWVEEPLELPLGDDLVVTGRLDLACRGDDGLEVIDFKVRSRKGLDLLRPDLQVQTYALACERAKQARVGRLIVHLLAEQPGSDQEFYAWCPHTRQGIEATLNAAADGIREGRFTPTPGPYCELCDFRAVCPVSAARSDHAATVVEEDEPAFGADP